ncbi:hypothetical protein HPT29_018600 [Microvirga terrae]|uniref:Fork-head domain-containing protein n=1 Tax=Microvirga terrae TaxID=2740529 RepID=A0ABY5RMM9_9HYPH|nr:hypothetical protein [Microvirga terrae]UVF18483.1 hypothetical protein HPT29_018600 [Microvirga terrae]
MTEKPTHGIAPKDMPTFVQSGYAVRLDEHPLYCLLLAAMERNPKQEGTRQMLQVIYAMMLSSAFIDGLTWQKFDRYIEELLEHYLQLNGSSWTLFRNAAKKLNADAERHLALARERRGRSERRSMLEGETIYPS